jgi:hypothetical protein
MKRQGGLYTSLELSQGAPVGKFRREPVRDTNDRGSARREERMDLQRQFDIAHHEHQDILEFLNSCQDALMLLESDQSDVRHKGLSDLKQMREKIADICEHCKREEEDPDSPLFRFAQVADRGRMKDEHFRLYRANYEFRRELELTEPAYTGDLILLGQKLLSTLRGHILYEEGLLKRFESDGVCDALATTSL